MIEAFVKELKRASELSWTVHLQAIESEEEWIRYGCDYGTGEVRGYVAPAKGILSLRCKLEDWNTVVQELNEYCGEYDDLKDNHYCWEL
jgi:hypothetical protein